MKSFICLLLGFMFFGDSCCSDYKCSVTYNFELPLSLYLAKDTFHIGDTIKIAFDFPNSLLDTKTQKNYTLENFNFYSEMGIVKFDNDTFYLDGFRDFSTVVKRGTSKAIRLQGGSLLALTLEHEYNNNRYIHEAWHIPKKTGRYYMSFSSYIPEDVWLNGTKITEDCTYERFECSYKNVGNGVDNNYYLTKTCKHELMQRNTYEDFTKAGGYAFVVTD